MSSECKRPERDTFRVHHSPTQRTTDSNAHKLPNERIGTKSTRSKNSSYRFCRLELSFEARELVATKISTSTSTDIHVSKCYDDNLNDICGCPYAAAFWSKLKAQWYQGHDVFVANEISTGMSTHELIVDYLVSDEFIRFYSIFQHLAIVCSFLTFGLLLFVILHASTTAMRTYKWFVLHEAIWNLVVDLFISTWQVVSLFPLGCGFSSSTWFRYTNSNVSQSFFQIIAFCCVGKLVAMMLTLAYRFSQIIPQGNVLLRLYNRLTPWAQVTSFIIGQIIVTPLFYTSAERRAEIRRELETSNIVINQIYKDEPTLICIASYGIPKTTLVIMLMVVPFACLLFFLAAITASWILRKQRHTLRPTTLKLQKMFFFASNMHVACACLLLGVPLFIILAAPYYPTHYTNNVVCLVVCVTSLHSIADCIILLYFIRPYRQYLRKFWTQCRGRQIPLNRYRTSFTDIWTTQKPRLSVVVPVAWQ